MWRHRESARLLRAAAASPRDRCAATARDCVSRSASSRSRDRARCAPRLPGTSAWISSMMTVSREVSRSRAFDVSSRKSDSGVVMRMSAASRPKRARSSAGVSPVRIAISGTVIVRLCARATAAMPSSGARRLRSTSTASALSGEMYRTRHRDGKRRRRREHQAVETPEKCRERLAAAGGREHESGFAASDRRPAELLRRGRRGKRLGEPLGHSRVEYLQGSTAGHTAGWWLVVVSGHWIVVGCHSTVHYHQPPTTNHQPKSGDCALAACMLIIEEYG